MRYWKCVEGSSDFYPERIYETNDRKSNYRDETGFLWIREIDDIPNDYGKFKEVTKKDYLFQLEKEGKLKFNEQDFVNGDLAVKLNGYCDFSEELTKICDKNKLINGWNFDGDNVYFVVGKTVEYELTRNLSTLPTVIIEENLKEEEEENKMRKFKVGDKVRIIKKLNSYHGFKIGDEVEIIEEDEDDLILTYKCKGEKYTNSPWVNSKEIELIGIRETFELNILSKDGVTTCTYKLNGETKKKESVSLYYKDKFDVETGVKEVLKKVFTKTPHEIFELKLENKLGHKPSNEELIEAYRKEIK